MARLIQETIKKPLADEVLFGKLKAAAMSASSSQGRGRREKLGFEYLDGPVTPKPEKIPSRRVASRSAARVRRKRNKPPGPKGGGDAAAARLGAESAAGQGLTLRRRKG